MNTNSYTTIAVIVAGFIVSGVLTPGKTMIFDTNTPALAQTAIFIVVTSLVIAGFAIIRSKLGTSVAQRHAPADALRPAGSERG